MGTQKSRLLTALKSSSLTTFQAITSLGILCPWKRVAELKADGHRITSEMFTVERRDGSVIRLVRYHLEREAGND